VTLHELNAASRDQFVETIGWVFEHSPWVAERAWIRRPFEDRQALHGAMVSEMKSASREEQLALVSAHPDLGTRARMSEASTGEQAGAGLGALSRTDFERLHRLNDAYRTKFGFPFLYAVKGSTPDQILDALERRLPGAVDEEFAEALRQVSRIAWFRIESTIEGSPS
jgi:2-oxo-4-hydroxy-4-carboxy-5-ureidoimidazoline decarboxylase